MARGDLRAIIALDPEKQSEAVYELPSGQWASEPVFVPRPGVGADKERDVYVMTLCHDDAHDAGMIVVLDAQDIGAGPVARVWSRIL